jgi:3-methyladenine DNA glycosylase AlkD
MKKLKQELKKHADKEKAKLLQRFFKTGKGEYGEGDVFLGIVVPNQRKIAREFGKDLSFAHIQELLDSKIHEERLIGLLILIERYKKSDEKNKEFIFNFYLNAAKRNKINNWDLVDLSAHKIVGDFLLDEDREILYKLARSDSLWEKRISIISCFAFIRAGDFTDAIKISEILLKDKHDLIHKAVGWMLREIGKKDLEVEEKFLRKYYKEMPRTMLRYAIERFEEGKRKKYLRGEIN